MIIKFEVEGEPQGKQRPRILKSGHRYTPEKTANYEELVKLKYWQAAKGFKFEKGVPLKMCINAYLSIPKSTSQIKKKNMLSNRIVPTKKPDVDNIAKIILDALNKVAYSDDAQVVELEVVKRYCTVPRVEVTIEGGLYE